jgi:4-hydroxy-4-methyl-2-oxoglutarate aldolase
MPHFGKVYTQIDRPDPELLLEFKEIGVSTIYESMDNDMLMEPSIRPITGGHTIAGPAITALNTPGDNLTMHFSLSLSKPGDILVTSFLGSHSYNALWGELATCAAVGRGLAGVIVDGAVRDVKAFTHYNFPVWARHVFSRTSTVKEIGGINVPAVCGGVLIYPGDIIVADDDGVVVVPLDQAEAVLKRAKAKVKREESVRDLLLQGSTPFEVFGMDKVFQEKGIEIVDGKSDSVRITNTKE